MLTVATNASSILFTSYTDGPRSIGNPYNIINEKVYRGLSGNFGISMFFEFSSTDIECLISSCWLRKTGLQTVVSPLFSQALSSANLFHIVTSNFEVCPWVCPLVCPHFCKHFWERFAITSRVLPFSRESSRPASSGCPRSIS